MKNPKLTYLPAAEDKNFPLRQVTGQDCAFATAIQHCTGNPRHSNYTRKIHKRHPYRQGRSKNISIC